MRSKRQNIGNTEEWLIIILFSCAINQTFFGLQESFCSCHSCSLMSSKIHEDWRTFSCLKYRYPASKYSWVPGLTCLTGALHSLYLLLGMSPQALSVLLFQMENEEMALSAKFSGPPALWLVGAYKMAVKVFSLMSGWKICKRFLWKRLCSLKLPLSLTPIKVIQRVLEWGVRGKALPVF